MEPKEGLLTFRGEGNNIRGDVYYSRMIHFPVNYNACTGAISGVTIGRGYDLGGRSVSEVLSDLLFSGLSVEQAEKISRGTTLRGCQAARFVKEEKESIGEITEKQQLRLFKKTFPEYVIRARNNYNHWTKGKPNINKWDALSLPIKNTLTDFVYQGYTKGPHPMMADAHNDKDELIDYIKNSSVLSKDEISRNRVAFLRG